MNVDPMEKMITKSRIEKYILRKAFDTTDEPETAPYLPEVSSSYSSFSVDAYSVGASF